jgi:hypothetical protein
MGGARDVARANARRGVKGRGSSGGGEGEGDRTYHGRAHKHQQHKAPSPSPPHTLAHLQVGRWVFVDCCWGSGRWDHGRLIRDFSAVYFDCRPQVRPNSTFVLVCVSVLVCACEGRRWRLLYCAPLVFL